MSIKYFRCVIIQLLNKFAVSAMVLRRWDLTVVIKKGGDNYKGVLSGRSLI